MLDFRTLIDLVEKVEVVDTGRIDGKMVRLFQNPSRGEFLALVRAASRMRFLVLPEGGFFVWNAYEATHHQVWTRLGLDVIILGEIEKAPDGTLLIEVAGPRHREVVERNEHFRRITQGIAFRFEPDFT